MPGWALSFLALSAIWGSSFAFIKVGLEALEPVQVAAVRVGLGALALGVALRVRGVALPRTRAVWGHLAVAAVLTNVVPFTLIAFGETRVSSVLAGLVNAMTPLVTVVAAALTLPEERPTAARLVGIGIGFAGALVLLGFWRGLGDAAWVGIAACVGATVCYGLGTPYQRRHLIGRGIEPLSLAAGQLVCASVLLWAVVPFVSDRPASLPLDVVGAMAALGCLGTGLAYLLMYRLVAAAGPTIASTVTYLIPVVSTALGVGVLGEEVHWEQPVGGAIVILGVAVAQGLVRLPAGRAGAPGGARDPGA